MCVNPTNKKYIVPYLEFLIIKDELLQSKAAIHSCDPYVLGIIRHYSRISEGFDRKARIETVLSGEFGKIPTEISLQMFSKANTCSQY